MALFRGCYINRTILYSTTKEELMKKLGVVLVAVFLLFSVQSANAYTCSQETAIPSGTVYTPGAAGGGGLVGGAVSFQLNTATCLSFTVTDGYLYGDVYELLVDGAFVGQTSAVALNDSSGGYSTGTFVVSLAAGSHTFDLWDIVLSYIGEDSPFGGGTVTNDFTPAGVYLDYSATTCTPVPAALPLFASGLLPLGIPVLRRRKSKA
jgi:hypothetical protein